jgi:3-hydroxyisobutyrate dehydrogenase-like beta-hydroxyacid dehydrogenase
MIIGIIGLGEVGSRYAAGITKDGADTKGYDLLLGKPVFQEKESRCRDAGVKLANSPDEIIEGCDLILAITTCAQAIETVEMYKSFLKKGQIYIDFNSAIPSIKVKVKSIVEATGAAFCDACSMNSPLRHGHHNQVVISGKLAKKVADILNSYNMNIKVLGEEIGQASAYKVIRSIFTKGSEALLIESLSVARRLGIMDEVFESLVDFLSDDTAGRLSALVRTDVIHAKRRAEEVGAVSEMLKEMNMDNTMSSAAYKKLLWSADIGLKEKFNSNVPENLSEVIDAFLEIKAT